MPPARQAGSGRLDLVDALDHLLNRGAVLVGDATLSIAGVDLVYLGLQVLVASVETLEAKRAALPADRTASASSDEEEHTRPLHAQITEPYSGNQSQSLGVTPSVYALAGATEQPEGSGEARPEQGLARLVLTLVDLLRRLVERQALRRMEGERLSEDEVERMGVALMELETKMKQLREVFGLHEGDLQVDLGPLGTLF